MSPWPTLHTRFCQAPPESQEHSVLLPAPGGGVSGEGFTEEGEEGARQEERAEAEGAKSDKEEGTRAAEKGP